MSSSTTISTVQLRRRAPIARTRHLSHWFGHGEAQKQVLFDLDLKLLPGEIILMSGPSGSGKTTLLTLIGALRSVQQGGVEVLGRELSGLSQRELVEVRRRIGFIFQGHNLFESLTAYQNVQLATNLYPYSRAERHQRITDILTRLGLEHRLHYKPQALSGGQRQRVAIARALVNRPKLILADEPTAALDKDSGREVVTLLQQLARDEGCTVLLVTHDNRIRDIADRIVNLVDGRLAVDVDVQEAVRICEFLAGSSQLGGVDTNHLLDLAARMVRQEYEAGMAIVRPGEFGDRFMIILSGVVDVQIEEEGGPTPLATLRSGDVLSELSLLTSQRRTVTAVAREDVDLYACTKEAFRAALETSDSLRDQVCKVVFQLS
jgi:putative ABC transport system ATP-binding protein